MTEARIMMILDPVAEAMFASQFDEPLPPEGHIERALYRQMAEAGLRAAVAAWLELGGPPARAS